MTSDAVFEVRTPQELEQLVPYLLGYHPGDDQIVLLGAGNLTVAAWQVVDAMQSPIEPIVAALDTLEAEQPHQYVVLAYGPHYSVRAEQVGREVHRLTGRPTSALAVGTDWIELYDAARSKWVTAIERRRDLIPAEFVFLGLPEPAASRDQLLARYQPLPQPTWAATSLDRIANLAQSFDQRTHTVVELVTAAAQPGAIRNIDQLASIGRAIGTDLEVRDAVLIAAITISGAGDLLVDVYRGAPPQYRSATAAVAAWVAYIQHGNRPVTEQILTHVDPDSSHANLAALLDRALDASIPPDVLRDKITDLVTIAASSSSRTIDPPQLGRDPNRDGPTR